MPKRNRHLRPWSWPPPPGQMSRLGPPFRWSSPSAALITSLPPDALLPLLAKPQLRAVGRVHSYVIVWRVLVGLYAAATVVALVIVNADQSDAPAAAGVIAAAALALGWGTGSGWGVVVAWFLVPLALPFGDTNQFVGDDHTDPVVLLAVASTMFSTVLILAAAGARALYNRHRPDGRAREDYPDGRASKDYSNGRASEASEAGALQAPDPPNALEPDLGDAPPINSPPAAHRR